MFTYSTRSKNSFGVLADGWRLYTSSFTRIIFLTFILAIIGALVDILQASGYIPVVAAGQPQSPVALWLFLLIFLVNLWLAGAVYHIIDQTGNGKRVGIGAGLAYAGSRYLVLLITAILVMIMIIIGTIIFIIPGIILSVFLFLAYPLVIVDNKGVGTAIGDSFKLVAGNWWHTFFVILIPSVIILVLNMLAIVSTSSMGADQLLTPSWVTVILVVAINTFITPWIFGANIALLNNIKLRKKLKQAG